jgi:RNA polymerase sigma-70 factor (ECF subfamily)
LRHLVQDDVKRALEALPDEYRMVVLLADLEDFAYKEIADIVGCPVGTVMSRLFRGRRLLRKSLAEFAKQSGYIKE